MSYTKGPWEWWTSCSMKRLSGNDKDGGVMYPYVCRDGVADVAIREEDMALIAAAPDMAEALQRLIAAYSSSYSSKLRADCWDQARAALAKAGL